MKPSGVTHQVRWTEDRVPNGFWPKAQRCEERATLQLKRPKVVVFHRGPLNTSDLLGQASSGNMSGACSCEVKELSPGRDLLLAANWNSIFDAAAVKEPERPKLPPPVIAEGSVEAKASIVLAGASGPAPAGSKPRFSKVILWSGVGLTALLVLGTGLISLRSKPRP